MQKVLACGVFTAALLMAISAPDNRLRPGPAGRPQSPSNDRTDQPLQPARGAFQTRLKSSNGRIMIDAEVNGRSIPFLVDTGAGIVALTPGDAARTGVVVPPGDMQVIGVGASGPVRGWLVTLPRISYNGISVENVRAAVVEGLPVSLLGQSFLSAAGPIEIVSEGRS